MEANSRHVEFSDATLAEKREFARKLSRTNIYRDYKKAYTTATGLPLALSTAGSLNLEWLQSDNTNPFCSLMADSNQSCVECLRV